MDIYLIEQKIKTHIASLPEFETRPFSYRMSKAGDCPRLMDYVIQKGESAPDPSQAFRMYFGTQIHTMWRTIFEAMLPEDFHGAEDEVKYEETVDGEHLLITGHPDGQIKSLDAVYELKSVSDNSFSVVQGKGYAMPMHYEQANMYAYVLQRKNIVFHYFNKNNSESLFLTAPASQEMAMLTIEKFRQRKRNEKTKAIADRPYADPSESPCWFCKHKAECFSGYAQQVSAMTTVELHPANETELHSYSAATVTARVLRLECEKTESNAKAELARLLIGRGIKSMKIGAFTVDIKLGTKNNPIVTVKKEG